MLTNFALSQTTAQSSHIALNRKFIRLEEYLPRLPADRRRQSLFPATWVLLMSPDLTNLHRLEGNQPHNKATYTKHSLRPPARRSLAECKTCQAPWRGVALRGVARQQAQGGNIVPAYITVLATGSGLLATRRAYRYYNI